MGKFVTIQERSRLKALTAMDHVDDEIDKFIDNKCKTNFDMYKYLVKLGWSSRVVKFIQGEMAEQIFELKNEEDDEQLEEGYGHFTPKQKQRFIDFCEQIEADIVRYCNNYKPVRKVRVKTPAQLVKNLPYLKEYEGYKSINPEEIVRSRQLYTYNTSTRKLSMFEGHLSVKGSKITGFHESQEKLLTDLTFLDRLVRGGDIIASRFMDQLRTKAKEANSRITKNTLLVKVVK
jgi:hypothetical protein